MSIKKSIISCLFLLLFLSNTCHAQNDTIKALLFLSMTGEELDISYKSSINIVNGLLSDFDNFEYEYTPPIELPVMDRLPEFMEEIGKYKIQLFKINNKWSVNPYYILRIFSCNTFLFQFDSELWLRVAGYKECDMKLLFDELKKQGLSKKDIKELVLLWSKVGGLFSEVDWDCILRGYYSNNTHYNCFISNTFFQYNARYRGKIIDIFAFFSNKPLSGYVSH